MTRSAYTRRAYNADLAANAREIATVEALLSDFQSRHDAGEPLTLAWGEEWNAAHDRKWDLEEDRHQIEMKWTRRHWTHSDYTFAELVSANAD